MTHVILKKDEEGKNDPSVGMLHVASLGGGAH